MKLSPKHAILAFLLVAVFLSPSLFVHGEDAGSNSESRRSSIINSSDVQQLGRCPICGDFLYKHGNPTEYPNFECIPKVKDKRGLTYERRMICPVCNGIIDVDFVKELDSSGGIDSDFCFHSLKKGNYTTNLYTCIDCGYTAFADGFYELPTNRSMVDPVLEKTVQEYFKLTPEFKSWVRNNLTKDVHDILTKMAKQVHSGSDWSAIKSQSSIPFDLKAACLARCYTQLRAPNQLLCSIYQKLMYIYRNEYCKASVIKELKRGYMISLPVFFAKDEEFFKEESQLLEELARMKHGDIADTIAIKWADYTTEELINKFIEGIKWLNDLIAGTAPEKDLLRLKQYKATKDDLHCTKFVMFLALSACYLRIGESELAEKVLINKAKALIDEGKLFSLYPVEAPEGSNIITRSEAEKHAYEIITEKICYLKNHQTYLIETLDRTKGTIMEDTLKAMYYPVQTYLIGNLYYRSGKYRAAKIWLTMAHKAAIIYEYIGLPTASMLEYRKTVEAMLSEPLIANAENFTPKDLPDLEYLICVKEKIEEYDLVRKQLTAKPQECREFLEFMWKVFSRYKATYSEFPVSLDSLVKMELLSKEATNDFKCPVTGKRYGYTIPSSIAPNTIYPLMFDEHPHDDSTGILGYILYSDGTIKHILSRTSLPDIGPDLE